MILNNINKSLMNLKNPGIYYVITDCHCCAYSSRAHFWPPFDANCAQRADGFLVLGTAYCVSRFISFASIASKRARPLPAAPLRTMTVGHQLYITTAQDCTCGVLVTPVWEKCLASLVTPSGTAASSISSLNGDVRRRW